MGLAAVVLVTAVGASVTKVPMLFASPTYYGQFSDTGGLMVGDYVRIDGVNVGTVKDMDIDRDKVIIGFDIGTNTIGTDSRALIKTETILGRKAIEIEAKGTHKLPPRGTLPLSQTSTPYQIYDAIFDVTRASQGWDTKVVKESLNVLSETVDQTSPHLTAALEGVQKLSETIGKRDDQIRSLLGNANKIATILGDRSGQINALLVNAQTLLHALNQRGEAIGVLEQQSDLKGLLLRSNKAAFIVGADITEFLSLFLVPEEQLSQWLHFANSVFNRLEDLPVPTIAAVNGYALGGGCECVLATDYRLATPDLRIGLPETKLGIMPGFGGSVRMPRMLGADSALEIIAAGKDVGADQALKIGLVDGVVKAEKLVEGAIAILRQAINGDLDWKAKRQPKLEPLKLSKIEAAMSFTIAKGMVAQTAGKHYPAPITAVKTIEAAARFGREEALNLENKSFVPLAHTNEARALVGIFLNDQYVKGKAKKLTKDVETPKQAAVLGAGIMGGGIAYQSAWKGVPVVMKDINDKSLTLGMTEAAKLLNKQLERGKIDGLKLAGVISTIHPTLDYAGFDRVDVVVEAVVENPKVKKAVLAETEQKVRPDTVLASNTSTIPISELANALERPENFCGMHFFNPVHRMPLVEIIRGEKSSDETIAKVVAWASKMGKTPIVVNDCPGFFVNRVLFPYFAGFSQLLRDGAGFRKIDKVMEKQFGWPMGPAYLLDVVGIDTAHHAQAVMAAGFPQRMQKDYRDAIDALFDANRFGQKNGLGFWRYKEDSKGKPKKEEDVVVDDLLAKVSQPKRDFSEEEIIARMMIPMVNEVVRCLEEGIIATPAEADMALVYGLGFPPFHGGAFRWLDTLGSAKYLDMAQQYQHLGPLYEVPEGLRNKARHNEPYYPPVEPARPVGDLKTA